MSIADKIGVCLTLADTTGPCRYTDKLAAAMSYLGLDMIRTRAPQYGADSWRFYQAVAAHGYRFLFTHRPGRDPGIETNDIAAFHDLYPSCVVGYEGPNEPDLNPVTYGGFTDPRRSGPTWTGSAALSLMHAQRDLLRRFSQLNYVQIVAFNDWMQAQQSPFTNLANSHIYPNNQVLFDRLPGFEKLVAHYNTWTRSGRNFRMGISQSTRIASNSSRDNRSAGCAVLSRRYLSCTFK